MFGHHDLQYKVFYPTLVVDKSEKELKEEEGTLSANDDDDLSMNESDETLRNPKSTEKRKLGVTLSMLKEHALRIQIQM